LALPVPAELEQTSVGAVDMTRNCWWPPHRPSNYPIDDHRPHC